MEIKDRLDFIANPDSFSQMFSVRSTCFVAQEMRRIGRVARLRENMFMGAQSSVMNIALFCLLKII